MAVVSVLEIQESRGGSFGNSDDQETTRTFRITCNDNNDNDILISVACWSAATLPRPFIDTHPHASNYLCKRLDIRQEHGKTIWIATARYDTRPLSKEDKDRAQEPNPINRDAVWSGQFEHSEKPVDKDTNDDPILNTADDVYPDPVIVPRTGMRIHGRMNVAPTAIPSWFLSLKDKINDSEYNRFGLSFPEKTLIFYPGDISEPQEENETDFITIQWDLEFKEETWKEKRVNNGFNQIVDSEKVPIEIDGDRPTEPQLLKEDGSLEEDPANAVFNEWDVIETADFSVLP